MVYKTNIRIVAFIHIVALLLLTLSKYAAGGEKGGELGPKVYPTYYFGDEAGPFSDSQFDYVTLKNESLASEGASTENEGTVQLVVKMSDTHNRGSCKLIYKNGVCHITDLTLRQELEMENMDIQGQGSLMAQIFFSIGKKAVARGCVSVVYNSEENQALSSWFKTFQTLKIDTTAASYKGCESRDGDYLAATHLLFKSSSLLQKIGHKNLSVTYCLKDGNKIITAQSGVTYVTYDSSKLTTEEERKQVAEHWADRSTVLLGDGAFIKRRTGYLVILKGIESKACVTSQILDTTRASAQSYKHFSILACGLTGSLLRVMFYQKDYNLLHAASVASAVACGVGALFYAQKYFKHIKLLVPQAEKDLSKANDVVRHYKALNVTPVNRRDYHVFGRLDACSWSKLEPDQSINDFWIKVGKVSVNALCLAGKESVLDGVPRARQLCPAIAQCAIKTP